ncbi:TMEM43 family protein [Thiorhodovibrio frisius]|uniref:Ca2+/Na+ antiporter n=1 Tax=Thiorhodovibrio frisius TaxID=631362 RepID=H8YYI8_9GAMM|nr:TMEM43 family protein [Thiorhodovibrio frisius]EIC23514.1 Ca2+/Na+ antiporter [Thiorhodovibrio frisius]WPL23399.1 Tellurite resistance protein TerB [Thiorhodovibrio frisius]
MATDKKNRWAGLLLGPAIVFIGLGAIWKNETRFDYHQAAQQTQSVQSPRDLVSEQRFSYTGNMDQGLVMDGDYVETFTGYLMVRRSAEIYAWDKDTDSDDHVTWTRRWMSSVESNSRNQGIRQQLSSRTFTLAQYDLGDLAINGARIEFVDKTVEISPQDLQVTHSALQDQGGYLYLSKGQSDNLGDERVRYTGIPVPATATYFGKAAAGRGVADTSQARTGMINDLIQDSGILHHLVAGERETALATMAAHISRLKWIVRGLASVAVILGFNIFFSTILGVLYSVPVIGNIARSGAFVLSLVLGIPLILITMLGGFFLANPLVPAVLAALLIVGIIALRQRKKQTRKAVYQDLQTQYGPQLETLDMTELEFIELAKLVFADGQFDPKEEKFLRDWSRKQGWNDAHFATMLAKAKDMGSAGPPSRIASEEHLKTLIRLALADGNLSREELKSIEHAGKRLGYDQKRIARLTQQVLQLATTKAAHTA